MSIEKFIHGKRDSSRHEGKVSEIRRLDSADFKLEDSQIIFDGGKPIPRNVFNRRRNRNIAHGRVDGSYIENGQPRGR